MCLWDLVQWTIIIWNVKMDVMKIVKCLGETCLLVDGVSEIIKNEAKEQKSGFLSMLFGTLGTSLLGNLLTGKGTKAKIPWMTSSKSSWRNN